jgi:hypothetical protein
MLAALHCAADNAQRGSIAAGCQCAGIAVGKDSAFLRHQLCTVGSHGLAGSDVFVVHGLCVIQQSLAHLIQAGFLSLLLGEKRFHAIDGPEEIDCCGSRAGKQRADLLKFRSKLFRSCGLALLCAQCNAKGGRDADCRRAAHDHGYDDIGNLLIAGGQNVSFFQWELGLVDKPDAFGGPFEGENHAFSV